jgi:hypothetical protein
MDEKRAYAIAAVDVSQEEVAANLTDYRHYCPVTYVDDTVSISSPSNDWLNIIKCNGKFYHPVSSEYRAEFLISPIPFIHSWSGQRFEFTSTDPENHQKQNMKGMMLLICPAVDLYEKLQQ